MDYQEAGQTIIRMRKARGWSRREFARQAGLSETTIRNLEAGGRTDGLEYAPTDATLREVAAALGGEDAVELLRLYGRDEMARYVEARSEPAGLRVVRDDPALTPGQERALERIMEELTRLLASANLTSHKGAYVSSPILTLHSSSAA